MFDVNCKLCRTFITQESQEKTGGGGIISVAQMSSDTEFTYGLSGLFVWKVDLGLRKGDSLCNNCLKEHQKSFEPALTIPCAYCDELFQPVFDEGDGKNSQGWGNASSVRDKNGRLRLSCGYGSHHDCTVFDVVVPVVKVGDHVCDKCIDLFVREGSLVENRDLSGII